MLLENPNYYRDFFDSNIFGHYLREHAAVGSDLVPDIKASIVWAREVLQRSDRIVWFLRLFRIALAKYLQDFELAREFVRQYNRKTRGAPIESLKGTDLAPVWRAREETSSSLGLRPDIPFKIRRVYGAVEGLDLEYVAEGHWTSLTGALEHYAAMGMLGDEVEFGWKLPEEFIGELSVAEREAAVATSRKIPVSRAGDYEEVIDFGDGYKWFYIDEYFAPDEIEINQELEVMFHAGESASRTVSGHCATCDKYHQRALVLRKFVRSDKGNYWRPVLFFCLDPGTGFLGETKGLNNGIPDPRYHKYIIPLLEHSLVKGNAGGGYMPESNWLVTNLRSTHPMELAALVAAKPDLLTLTEKIKIRGYVSDEDILTAPVVAGVIGRGQTFWIVPETQEQVSRLVSQSTDTEGRVVLVSPSQGAALWFKVLSGTLRGLVEQLSGPSGDAEQALADKVVDVFVDGDCTGGSGFGTSIRLKRRLEHLGAVDLEPTAELVDGALGPITRACNVGVTSLLEKQGQGDLMVEFIASCRSGVPTEASMLVQRALFAAETVYTDYILKSLFAMLPRAAQSPYTIRGQVEVRAGGVTYKDVPFEGQFLFQDAETVDGRMVVDPSKCELVTRAEPLIEELVFNRDANIGDGVLYFSHIWCPVATADDVLDYARDVYKETFTKSIEEG